MPRKRPEFSFPELEQRGRNAILRSSAEVEAEEALLAEAGVNPDPATAPVSDPVTPAVAPSPSPSTPARRTPKRPAVTATGEPANRDTHASVRARTRAPKASFSSAVIDRLRQKLLTRQHLSSYAFRFRAEELEQLDRLVGELNRDRSVKLSKNDLVRLALGWLLTDYEEYGPESLVVEVTRSE